MFNDGEFEQPVAVPLVWAVMAAVMIWANLDDARSGDWLSIGLLVASAAMGALAGTELFNRFRRR